MSEVLKPASAEQVRDAVRWALSGETPLELVGHGSKRALGRPSQTSHRLDLSGLSGVSSYEPEELVLTAAAATPMAEVEALLAQHHQQLDFEPADYGPILGASAGAQTLGGVLACNISGPRRIKAGAARDHFLGVEAVSGRGEVFRSGGRVVKNVTGYDLCKLLAGSHGTLAVMTEVSIKVLPAPEKTRTVLVLGLDDAAAVALLSEAMQSAHEVSGAAHLPAAVAGRSAVSYVKDAGQAVTALRVEGPGPSVAHRCEALLDLCQPHGDVEELHSHNSQAFWREVRDVSPLLGDGGAPLWRISVPPTEGPAVVAAMANRAGITGYYDWAGGLVWLTVDDGGSEDAEAEPLRAAMAGGGGHATLIRAPVAVRAAVPVFHPQPAALAALSARIKFSFDPNGILNPGRMYAGV